MKFLISLFSTFAISYHAAGIPWTLNEKPVQESNHQIRVPGNAMALAPAPAGPYEISFEALVPEVVDGEPDFGTPQVWFSVDYRGPQDQLAFALRGGRLQDAVGYDFHQRDWAGTIANKMSDPKDKAFEFRFHRLPGRENRPVTPGKWVRANVKVGARGAELWVEGQLMDAIHREQGARSSIGLGGSWQQNTFRNVHVAPLAADTVGFAKEFAPRDNFPYAILKVDFGPESMPVSAGWIRESETGGHALKWEEPPLGSRQRQQERASLRLSTLVILAHERKTGSALIQLPAGDHVVSIGVGDPAYASHLICIAPGGRKYRAATTKGEFAEIRFSVKHPGGQMKLAFEVEQGTEGGALSYLVVEPAEKFNLALSRPIDETTLATDEKRREQMRAEFRATKLSDAPAAGAARVSLDGPWLFMPENKDEPQAALAPGISDSNWHVITVPGFWNPVGWWIFGQGERTASQAFLYEELGRCEQFTFDWRNTSAGWYRKPLDVPLSYAGKRLSLEFEGVAAVCEVYLNGIRVGGNKGMFKPFSVDLSSQMQAGRQNLLAVWVGNGEVRNTGPKGKAGTAVTMTISQEMVTELPRGIYGNPSAEDGKAAGRRQGGIWQSVQLCVSGQARIGEVWPQTTDRDLKLRIAAEVPKDQQLATQLRVRLASKEGKEVFARSVAWSEVADAAGKLQFTQLPVELWSPEHPNLYQLRLELVQGKTVLDRRELNIGFRDFAISGGKFELNHKPWRFLGANMPPHGLHPNDRELAKKFIGFMRDGNQRALRAVCSPFPAEWLDETDRQGVAVSYEGQWPWVLFEDQPIPDEAVLKVWKEEWVALVKANRHHPSIFMWTLSNENYSLADKDLKRRQRKWEIWQDLIRATREADPTRPVVLWSGHTRANQVENLASVSGSKDDGDIDDRHCYAGTYQASMLRNPDDFWKGWLDKFKLADRPFLSQEGGTAYADTDLGCQTLGYLQTWHGQTWCGRQSYPNVSPAMFLSRTAQITKQQLEVTRRVQVQGWLAFCNATWYNNVDRADLIRPYPAHEGARLALQPRLVAIFQPPLRVTDGDSLSLIVFTVNDAENRIGKDWLTETTLEDPQGNALAAPKRLILREPALGGGVSEGKITIEPKKLGITRRTQAVLSVVAKDPEGHVLSQNRYGLVIFPEASNASITAVEVLGEHSNEWQNRIQKLGILEKREKLANHGHNLVLAIVPNDKEWQSLLQQAETGTRILVLDPHDLPDSPLWHGAKLFNADFRGEVADFTVEGMKLGLSQGLDPEDLAWWAGTDDVKQVYRKALGFPGTLPTEVEPWIAHVPPHGYDGKWRMDFPVVRFPVGQGEIVICSLNFTATEHDPAPGIMLRNLIKTLLEFSR